MRAVAPTDAGEVTLQGFGVYYETFGDPSAPTVLFFPSWQIVHSRIWKMQVPHFARFSRRHDGYLGVVQGGLSTTMELAANRRPFLYFPLKNHCEQIYHVAHRLDRYRAGCRVDYHEVSVDDLAGMMLETLGVDTSGYREHRPGGAERAARELTALL
jgi:hypothetical protein